MLVFQSSISRTFTVCQLNIANFIIYVALMVPKDLHGVDKYEREPFFME